MALGMKDPSYWGPQEKFKEAPKKTVTPIRVWDVKSGLTDRTLTLEEGGNAIYTTSSHFTIKKDPYVTIHHKGDEKTAIAGAKLDEKDSYRIYLGDPSAETGVGSQECEVVTGGNTMTRNHRFSPPGQRKDYAWRDTAQHEISLADSKVETSGRDWKFISLTSDGEEDELFAVYVNNPKISLKSKSQIFWLSKVSDDVELWGVAAVVGLLERKRKNEDKFNWSAIGTAGGGGGV